MDPEQIESGEQPTVTAADAAGEQPQDIYSESSKLDGISSEELLAALEGEEVSATETPEAEAPAPAPEAEQETPADEPEEDTPTAEATSSKPPERISVRGLPAEQRTETAAAIALIRDGKAADLADALSQLRGTPTPAAAEPEHRESDDVQEAPEQQHEQASPTVSEIKSKIATLREQRKEARSDYDHDRAEELTTEIEDLQIELLRAEQSERAQQVAMATFQAQQEAAIAEVEAKYPDAANEDSRFFRVLDGLMTAAENRGDPRVTRDPRFVIEMAEEVAEILGTAGKTPSAPAAKPAARKAPVPTGEGLAPGHDSAARPSQADLLKEVQTMPREQLEDILFTE